jgi:hypothetical protein
VPSGGGRRRELQRRDVIGDTTLPTLTRVICACGCLWLALHGAASHAQAAANDRSAKPASAVTRDAQHDFDFEFGDWKAHVKRRLRPLTGSDEWVEYDGPSIVRKVWDGRANLGEIDLAGPAGRIKGLSLRLYNPQTQQWNISWSNSNDGLLGPPMSGGFRDGRGEFFNQETLNGRAIYVRFIFSDITATTFRLEQAFSNDGGKSWEANWIATFTRV